jgi:hypothetical protein
MNYHDNDHYHTYIITITKQQTYNNDNLTKITEFSIIGLC